MSFNVPEAARLLTGSMGSDRRDGNNGVFQFVGPLPRRWCICIASDGGEWEHVSVTVREGQKVRTPTWEEMAFVKDRFWGAEDTVVQFHPPKSKYVNYHENCLHLWRPSDFVVPLPDPWMVGPPPMRAVR